MSDTYIAELGYRVDTRPLRQGEAALDRMTRSGERTETGINRLTSSVGILSAGIAALTASTAINEAINYSDAWTLVNNKLRVVIDSESELIRKRTELIALSKETNSNLDSTVALYSELYRTTRALGSSEEEVTKVTRTLNNLFVAGGKDAQTQASAIKQLTQALGAGYLSGEEFNTMADAAPRLLDAIAVSVGVARGELKAFAADGNITTKVMMGSIGMYAEEAQRLADVTGTTFEQNMQNVNTNVTAYIGASKSVTDATKALGETLEGISENIGAVVNGITTVTTAMLAYATVSGVKVVGAEMARIAATVAATKAEATRTAGTLAATTAEVARLTAEKQGLTLTIARTSSENIRNTVRTQLTKTTIALSVAETRLAAAETAAATAGARATTSAFALAGATTALGTAVRFLMGPWGLLITAVGLGASAFMSSKSASEEAAEALETQREKVEKLTQSYLNMSKAQIGAASISARNELLSLQLERQEAEERLKQAMSNVSNFGGGTATSIPIMKEISEIDGKIKDITTSLDAMNKAFESSLPDEWKGLDDDDKPDSLSKKFKSQMDSLKQLHKEIGLNSNELFVFRQEQQSIANKDAPAMTAAIVRQANEIVNARNILSSSEYFIQEVEKYGLERAELTKTADAYEIAMVRIQAARAGLKTEQINALVSEVEAAQVQRFISSISTASSEIARINEEIEKTKNLMGKGLIPEDIGKEHLQSLKDEIDALNKKEITVFDSTIGSVADTLTSIRELSKEGSKEYEALGVAVQALNAVQAISAVLNQAQGDPYSAPARMAAMAAMVASIAGVAMSIDGMSGGFTDDSVENQANQGLNVWGDKSESIANGIDLIASATESLVGINTNMLKALTSVQNGIAAAAVLIGRDTTTPQINTSALVDSNPLSFITDNSFEGLFGSNILTKALDFLTGNFIFEAIGSWLGGSSSVTDEGVRILGGSLGDMMDDITVQSFQSIKYKKWKFGGTKRKTEYQDITSEVGQQFQLVLDSIADSVFAGASMLGFSESQLSNAIQNFEIATIDISLKDLSAEEQQAEIEAVFSSIFDDLAGSVIPFLDEFQMVGEGLGETLARVATQVNIMDLMVEQLGVTMFDKFGNPKAYAEAAENIASLAGGVESLAEKTSGFIDSFAPDAVKLDIYRNSLESAFGGVGLALPGTASAMWDLMSSLDASTEAGQEQIATLLNSQETADAYYGMLTKITDGYRDAIDSMYDVTEAISQMTLDAALAAARMGDFSLASELDTSSLAPSIGNYSSKLEYDLARAETANKLEELAKLTEGSISVDERQLEALQQIKTAIEETSSLGSDAAISELKKEMVTMNEVQKGQARNIADSNAILQQMLFDGMPVRIEA